MIAGEVIGWVEQHLTNDDGSGLQLTEWQKSVIEATYTPTAAGELPRLSPSLLVPRRRH